MLKEDTDRNEYKRWKKKFKRDQKHYKMDSEYEYDEKGRYVHRNPERKKSTSGKGHVGEFAGLFNTTKHSDVTVYIGPNEHQLPAHGLILAVSSPYFDDALQSSFKEGERREFRFKEYSAHALWRVFQYMYWTDYSEESSKKLVDDGDDIQLLKHPRVYALADMFRMDDLKKVAVEKFRTQLQQHWISDTFPDCVREVYANTTSKNEAIRSVVVKAAKNNLATLWERSAFREVVREVGDFAVDLVDPLAMNR